MDVQQAPRSYSPPPYSPATDAPDYTSEPRPDEERVQISGRAPGIQERTGVFVEKTKHVTLALTDQVPNCTEPTYGKAALVQGALSPSKPEGVVSVEVTLEGVMELVMTSMAISGSTIIPLFSKQAVLFRQSEIPSNALPDTQRTSFLSSHTNSSYSREQSLPRGENCPSTMTFSFRLPTKYGFKGISRPLPPSYSIHFAGIPASALEYSDHLYPLQSSLEIPGLTVDVHYTLRIAITRRGPLRLDKKATLTRTIVFMPRSRPAQPALPPSLSFLSSLKVAPEGWKLFEAQTAVKKGHENSPVIRSALLLPQSQIFPIGHQIPFHLQISCTSMEILSQYSHISPPSAPSRSILQQSFKTLASYAMHHNPASSSESRSRPSPKRKDHISGDDDLVDQKSENRNSGHIYLSVQRHVTVEVTGRWLQLKKTLSTSTFKRCLTNDAEPSIAAEPGLVWEGHIEVSSESRCGGFGGPSVQVKDFILLSILPPSSEHSPLQEIHHLIPIRLTTDPHEENVMLPGVELTQ